MFTWSGLIWMKLFMKFYHNFCECMSYMYIETVWLILCRIQNSIKSKCLNNGVFITDSKQFLFNTVVT